MAFSFTSMDNSPTLKGIMKGGKHIGMKLSAITSTIMEDWQTDKTLLECNKYMLEHDIHDVTFKIVYQENVIFK